MLGAGAVLAQGDYRAGPVAAADPPGQLAVLLVGAGEDFGRVRDQRDQVGHLALDLGHRVEQAGRVGSLGDADVEADVGAPVLGEVLDLGRHLGDQLLEPG